MEIDPNSPVSIRAAARHLDRCDVVILQHEYGIFGDNDGEAVLDMVDSINRPLITVVHTVVSSPSDRQRRIMERLHRDIPTGRALRGIPVCSGLFALDPEK